MKSLKELAQEALDMEDASNLCGVAQAFARAMVELCQYTKSTEERNQHPITRLYVDKMASLAGCQSFDWDFKASYEEVEKLAR